MGTLFRRAVRAAVAVVAIALLAGACGSAEQPSLETAASGDQSSQPGIVLPEPEGADLIPTPKKPELIGLETALNTDPPPPALAFEATTETGVLAHDADLTLAGATDSELPADSPPDLEETQLEGTEEPQAEPLPTPPPAPLPGSPAYSDPSPILVAASGRAVDLLAEDDSAASVRGVTAQVITVGGLASHTLVDEEFRVDVCLGAEARFAQANHHQELSRSIAFDGCYDDTAQPALAAGLANTLVRDDVFAVVPMASPAFGAENTFREARLPYIGDDALPAFCGRASALGLGTWGAQACPVLDARGFVSLAEPVLTAYFATLDNSLALSIAYLIEDGPNGDASMASRAFEAELLEVPQPTFLPILPSAAQGSLSNWTEVVTATLATNPDSVIVEGGATDGLPNALRSLGFEGELILVGQFDPLTIADTDVRLGLAPATVVNPGFDLASRQGEGWGSLSGAAAAVGIAEDEIGLDFLDGYVAGDIFVRALAATAEPLTVERFTNSINAGWWYPGIEGVACGSWWPASHFAATPCVSVSRIDTFSDALIPVLGLVETEPQVRFELGN